jgi:hydrogenase maturation factor
MSIKPELAEKVIESLHNAGLGRSAIIGRVTAKQNKYLYLYS